MIFTSTQFKPRKSFTERMETANAHTAATICGIWKQARKKSNFTQTATKENSNCWWKAHARKKMVRFGLMVDLCCTFDRFDLSNACTNCAPHTYICFRAQARRQKISLHSRTAAAGGGCFATPCIELEPHHLAVSKVVLTVIPKKLPSKSFARYEHNATLAICNTDGKHTHEHWLLW